MIRIDSPGPAIPTVPISDCAVRLDTTRIYRDAYQHAGAAHGLAPDPAALREATTICLKAVSLIDRLGTEVLPLLRAASRSHVRSKPGWRARQVGGRSAAGWRPRAGCRRPAASTPPAGPECGPTPAENPASLGRPSRGIGARRLAHVAFASAERYTGVSTRRLRVPTSGATGAWATAWIIVFR